MGAREWCGSPPGVPRDVNTALGGFFAFKESPDHFLSSRRGIVNDGHLLDDLGHVRGVCSVDLGSDYNRP